MPRPNDVGVGVGVLICKDDSILLIKRKGSHGSGQWALPGGWIDRSDHDPKDVVIRECFEETSIVARDSVLLGVSSENWETFRSVTLYYLLTDWEGVPRICEEDKCSDMIWHPIKSELPTPTFQGLAEFLHKIGFLKTHTKS